MTNIVRDVKSTWLPSKWWEIALRGWSGAFSSQSWQVSGSIRNWGQNVDSLQRIKDTHGIIYIDYLQKEQRTKGEYYASLFHRRKRPCLAKKNSASIKIVHLRNFNGYNFEIFELSKTIYFGIDLSAQNLWFLCKMLSAFWGKYAVEFHILS